MNLQLRRTSTAAALVMTLLLAACGGSSIESSSGAAGGETAGGGEGGDVALDSAPIPFRDLYEYRDDSGPIARTVDVELDTCPLLSLATLEAASGTYSDPTTLSQATSQRCSFNNGPAFSFTVEVEPAASVDADNHSGRAYNIDVEPVVEPQSGPGDKAVILVDTAFADDSGEGSFRYLYFFVQGDQAVTLRSTAFRVTDDGWRILADEVAANLVSGVAGGAVETVEVIDVPDAVEPYTIEPCGFVTIDQLAALSGFAPADITADSTARVPCTWRHPEAGGLSVQFGANQGLYSEMVIAGADGDRSGELGIMAAGSAVYFDVWLVDDEVWGFTVNADREGWYAAADAIAVNLVQRVGKPEPL